MAPRQTRKKKTIRIVTDVVAIGHFLFCNAIILLGETTTLFYFIGRQHNGVEFVYKYLDGPVFGLLRNYARGSEQEFFIYFLVAEFIVVLSSLFYSAIAGVIYKILTFGKR